MSKSKTRLVADFLGKVQANAATGEAEQADLVAVQTSITGDLYNAVEIDAMFDDVITELENLAVEASV